MTMFSAIRTRFSYSNVAATMALVFALTGGAFAATSHPSGGSTGSKASASVTPVATVAKAKKVAPKSTRGPAGPKGTTGATGPAGPAGATGPAGGTGPQGPQGNAGSSGSNGEKGEPGASVTSAKASTTECPEGGTKFTAANGTSKACNGKEGSPWTAGGTLPPEKTETGAWSFGPIAQASIPEGGSLIVMVASFAIPLANSLSGAGCEEEPATRTQPCQVHFINHLGKEVILDETTDLEEEIEPSVVGACLGSAQTPAAAPGNFCVYADRLLETKANTENLFNPAPVVGEPSGGAGTTGAIGRFVVTGSEGQGYGTWAVTAPAA
jgi:hypothetical protein